MKLERAVGSYTVCSDDGVSRIIPRLPFLQNDVMQIAVNLVGGGEHHRRRQRERAERLEQRLYEVLSGVIEQAIDDAGIDAGDGWTITTISRESFIALRDTYGGAEPIYGNGAQYRIIMEAT